MVKNRSTKKKQKIKKEDSSNECPELVFGLVGPIGVDMEIVVDALQEALSAVNYNSVNIKISEIMRSDKYKTKINNETYFHYYSSLIEYADEIREKARNNAALAGLAISRIRDERQKLTGDLLKPKASTAYIIRQFKTPDEIDVLRKTYGRKFIQISVYGSELERKNYLIDKIKTYNDSQKDASQCEIEAIELITRDYNEKNNIYGQKIGDVFYKGDVFVPGTSRQVTKNTITRFILSLFGDNGISPTKAEYAMYIAAAASLRSIDLSRQVGAAIFSPEGEIISMGCNEVPKASGGTYWSDDEKAPSRDYDKGRDANQSRKKEIVFDFLSRLDAQKFLSKEMNVVQIDQKIEKIIKNPMVKEAQIFDIIEFGRMIHAEMSAICDASRLGRPINRGILYCTTFPCHVCAKHIIASGIQRVVFLEPYPKSYAEELHSDSITFNPGEAKEKVLFEPFLGISPRRYRDIFEKIKRKDEKGKAQRWYEKTPKPRIEDKSINYIENEDSAIVFTQKTQKRIV